jgi:hypothetical protein
MPLAMRIWRTLVSFDVLPNLVHRSLTHGLLPHGCVTIVADLPGRVRFLLTTAETLQPLGEVSVEKMSADQTFIYVYSPDDDLVDEDLQATHDDLVLSFRERLDTAITSRSTYLKIPLSLSLEIVGDPPGRPRMDHETHIERLTLAQEAKAIKEKNPLATWKTIARAIGWPLGDSDSGVKALRDARKELERADETILAEIAERATKTTKTT